MIERGIDLSFDNYHVAQAPVNLESTAKNEDELLQKSMVEYVLRVPAIVSAEQHQALFFVFAPSRRERCL